MTPDPKRLIAISHPSFGETLASQPHLLVFGIVLGIIGAVGVFAICTKGLASRRARLFMPALMAATLALPLAVMFLLNDGQADTDKMRADIVQAYDLDERAIPDKPFGWWMPSTDEGVVVEGWFTLVGADGHLWPANTWFAVGGGDDTFWLATTDDGKLIPLGQS